MFCFILLQHLFYFIILLPIKPRHYTPKSMCLFTILNHNISSPIRIFDKPLNVNNFGSSVDHLCCNHLYNCIEIRMTKYFEIISYRRTYKSESSVYAYN